MVSELEKAVMADRDAIVKLIHAVVKHLNSIGIPQWDEVYPCAANVDEDLRKGELYVVRANQSIAGIVTLNREYWPEYDTGSWSYTGS